MVILTKLAAIGWIVLSLAIGFLSYYIISDHSKEIKKQHSEELISQLINMVIFIWLGKIVLNFSVFLSDPLSILAYPSNSKVFYFAILMMAVVLFYKSKRKNLDVVSLLEAFVPIFLIGSFVYEFIQFVVKNNPYAFGYLILLAILIALYFFLRERVSNIMVWMVLITGWSMGIILLLMLQPFVTVFGYMMAPWFVGLFYVTSFIGLTYKRWKKDT